MRRHPWNDDRIRAWRVSHRAGVARGAVEIDHVDAAEVAHRHTDRKIEARIFVRLVDHS